MPEESISDVTGMEDLCITGPLLLDSFGRFAGTREQMFADRPDRSVGRNAARSGKFVRESPAGGNRWGKDPPTLQAVTIRRAVSTDDPVLRQLAAASKGHWGYDQARLRRWASEID